MDYPSLEDIQRELILRNGTAGGTLTGAVLGIAALKALEEIAVPSQPPARDPWSPPPGAIEHPDYYKINDHYLSKVHGIALSQCEIEHSLARKLDSCVSQVQQSNIEQGCPPEGLGSSECPNAYAVCRASISTPICKSYKPRRTSNGGISRDGEPIAVLDPYGSRCRDPQTGEWLPSELCGFEPLGISTSAMGADGLTHYDFEFKIVDGNKLIVSHDPFTFEPNSKYPGNLQPRLRERAATRLQVEKIAANLEPDAVLTDFHVLDRGSPIVGSDMVVEAGNGRVMGILRAAEDFPDKYAEYKRRLEERARDFGLRPRDVDKAKIPVLVRVRVSDVDRVAFTQEANAAVTLAPSAIENARTDAEKITMGMLQELVIGENQSLEDALRSPQNRGFARRFLATLPETVQASLVDAKGELNRDGVHRMMMAIFVSAFRGDPGLRLAEKAFESIDMDVRNTINAIALSLGPLAQAEALCHAGERELSLSIGDDLAQTVNVYTAIKRTPGLTVEKYLAQGQLLERELTDFQESILITLEKHKRAARRLAQVLKAYAQSVVNSAPPAQIAMIPGATPNKELLWENATKIAEAHETASLLLTKLNPGSKMPMYRRAGGRNYVLTNHAVAMMTEWNLSHLDVAHIFDHYDTSYVDTHGNERFVGNSPDGRRVTLVTAKGSDPTIIISVIVKGRAKEGSK